MLCNWHLLLIFQVLFDGTKAVAVEFLRNGEKYVVKATKEIILSAGVIGSPKLLLLSGIGPKHDLEKLNVRGCYLGITIYLFNKPDRCFVCDTISSLNKPMWLHGCWSILAIAHSSPSSIWLDSVMQNLRKKANFVVPWKQKAMPFCLWFWVDTVNVYQNNEVLYSSCIFFLILFNRSFLGFCLTDTCGCWFACRAEFTRPFGYDCES